MQRKKSDVEEKLRRKRKNVEYIVISHSYFVLVDIGMSNGFMKGIDMMMSYWFKTRKIAKDVHHFFDCLGRRKWEKEEADRLRRQREEEEALKKKMEEEKMRLEEERMFLEREREKKRQLELEKLKDEEERQALLERQRREVEDQKAKLARIKQEQEEEAQRRMDEGMYTVQCGLNQFSFFPNLCTLYTY